MISGLQIIERDICDKIKDELDKVGVLYRLFSRIKDDKSIKEKVLRKKEEGKCYIQKERLMQDIIGIRIVTYFKDDITLVKEILNGKINFIDQEIDEHELTVFKPKRTNIICAFNEKQKKIFTEALSHNTDLNYTLIDNTFELQLRTILSEGWHEIDHSLRYKCKPDWSNHKEDERMLNGIYANLEINDSVLKNLFNELAYKHYINKNWEALIRNKFRLKFQLSPLLPEIITIMNNDSKFCKYLVKINRIEILTQLSSIDLSLPVTLNNIIFLINTLYYRHEEILKLTPQLILDEFEALNAKETEKS
jgi:ppGpp synthetase/RelA/SpoT-type nucleotidyltranferase